MCSRVTKLQNNSINMKVGSQYLGNGVCEFTVWSPLKEEVAVHLISPEEKVLPMTEQETGLLVSQNRKY